MAHTLAKFTRKVTHGPNGFGNFLFRCAPAHGGPTFQISPLAVGNYGAPDETPICAAHIRNRDPKVAEADGKSLANESKVLQIGLRRAETSEINEQRPTHPSLSLSHSIILTLYF